MTDNAGAVVKAAYNLLLNREPEPAGLQYWAQALERGLPRDEFVRAVLNSPEFRHTPGSAAIASVEDIDLVIPVDRFEFRVPASDTSLVPHLLAHRCWEPHVMRFLERELRSPDVFVDVGANIGYFTVRCAPLVQRVVAFEPVAKSRRYCAMNIELNRLQNVDLRPWALWHEDATLQIRCDASCLGGAAVAPAHQGTALETIWGAALDVALRRGAIDLPRLDMLKMDIEGAEVSALAGMRQTIDRLRPRIVMEINRPALAAFGATIDDVWNFFDGLGYEISVFDQWKEREPSPVAALDDLKRLCPPDSLVDIVASPGR